MEKLSFVADIVGILSFIISIILWVKFDRIKNEIQQQRMNYADNQQNIRTNLLALRDNLFCDELSDIKIRSKLRTELYTYKFNLNYILGFTANLKRKKLLRMLKSDSFSVEGACECIDYLIARFDKKEVIE